MLVVGATGNLGGKVVRALLDRGKSVRALVRPSNDASKLEALDVEIARGDILDEPSLVEAMTGTDAVITTAAGYTHGGKQAHDIDTIGNANLAEAAAKAGVRRFVLLSILTSDRIPDVPHFWHKKLAEAGSHHATGRIKIRAIPRRLLTAVRKIIGRWQPLIPDMAAMSKCFDTGKYVADTTRQTEVFGAVPSPEDAIARFSEHQQIYP